MTAALLCFRKALPLLPWRLPQPQQEERSTKILTVLTSTTAKATGKARSEVVVVL